MFKRKYGDQPIEHLIGIANTELRLNETIEVYDMHNGEEFNRRPANPWLKLNKSMVAMTDMFNKLIVSVGSVSNAFSSLVDKIPKQEYL